MDKLLGYAICLLHDGAYAEPVPGGDTWEERFTTLAAYGGLGGNGSLVEFVVGR
jgi:hypothetical protein